MTGSALPFALVSTEWLARELGADDLRVLDASWHLPAMKRDAKAEFALRHVPGAVFFDIDEIADRSNPLPHMLPSADQFSAQVGALGVGDGDRVVAYDATGLMSAARAWWMFRVFGHERVAVLDGGLPKWLSEGRAVEAGAPRAAPRRFTARFRPELVRSLGEVRENLSTKRDQLVDARSRGRFAATDPEPRPGLRGGHIPGSRSLPYTELTDATAGTVLPRDRLSAMFGAAGIDRGKPVVASCGSGVTACVLALGLHLIGHERAAIYDGSWTEWGGRADTPIET
ncbi:MAG: 3-mercaptopyruvate sulfurtransferase [Alphaproteobacteria bacterium]